MMRKSRIAEIEKLKVGDSILVKPDLNNSALQTAAVHRYRWAAKSLGFKLRYKVERKKVRITREL